MRTFQIIVAALLAGVMLDTVYGAFVYDRNATTFTIAAQQPSHRLIAHLPGFVGNEWSTRALAPYLTKYGKVVGIRYATGGFNAKQIFKVLAAELNAQRTPATTEVWVLAQSMGAKVFRDFASWLRKHDPKLLQWLKDVKLNLVLDSAPASEGDIKTASPLGLLLAKSLYALGLRGSPLSSLPLRLSYYYVEYRGHPIPIGVDPKVSKGGREATKKLTWATIFGQAGFLSGYRSPTPEEFEGLVDDSLFVYGISPDSDPAINIARAAAQWRKALPGIGTDAIEDWDENTHSPNLERPRKYVERIALQFA